MDRFHNICLKDGHTHKTLAKRFSGTIAEILAEAARHFPAGTPLVVLRKDSNVALQADSFWLHNNMRLGVFRVEHPASQKRGKISSYDGGSSELWHAAFALQVNSVCALLADPTIRLESFPRRATRSVNAPIPLSNGNARP